MKITTEYRSLVKRIDNVTIGQLNVGDLIRHAWDCKSFGVVTNIKKSEHHESFITILWSMPPQ